MGWVKENLARENGKVEGLIISKSMDENIRYALVCISNIELKLYKFENDKLILIDSKDAYIKAHFEKLTPEQKEEFIRGILRQIRDNE